MCHVALCNFGSFRLLSYLLTTLYLSSYDQNMATMQSTSNDERFVAFDPSVQRKSLIKNIVFILIFLFFLIPVIFFIRQKIESQGKQRNTRLQASLAPSSAPTYTQITQELIAYIQSQKRSDGFYESYAHYKNLCDTKNPSTCPVGVQNSFPITNAWTSLAYVSGYQVFHKQQYLDAANRDTSALINSCSNDMKQCYLVLLPIIELYKTTHDQK